MENSMMSATYIPSRPPYQIIMYENKIGVQIGTQRITLVRRNPFITETHDYPVVAVEDRLSALQDLGYTSDVCTEGEVWDNIESKQVTILCKLGEQLQWQDFIRMLWLDHSRSGSRIQKIKKVQIFQKLLKYNGSMSLPDPGLHIIHLHSESFADKPKVVRSMKDDTFALNVEWTDDLDELEQRIVSDLLEYLLIISPRTSTKYWMLAYETEEGHLQPLATKLNANAKATRFHNTLMASFTIRAIPTYMDKDTTLVLPESLIDENLANKLRPIFYGDEDEARAFLNKIVKEGKNAKPTEITGLVNELLKKRIISQKSCKRPLYTVLRDAKLYLRSESNWNSQVKN